MRLASRSSRTQARLRQKAPARLPCSHASERLVRAVGVEPTRRCHRGILSPLRLPVPPRPLWSPDQMLSQFPEQMECRLIDTATFKQAERWGKASMRTSPPALESSHIPALLDCLNM